MAKSNAHLKIQPHAVGNPREDRRRLEILEGIFQCPHGIDRCQPCTTEKACPHECVECYVEQNAEQKPVEVDAEQKTEPLPQVAHRIKTAGKVTCNKCGMRGLVWRKSASSGRWYTTEIWSIIAPGADDIRERAMEERPHFLTCAAKETDS